MNKSKWLVMGQQNLVIWFIYQKCAPFGHLRPHLNNYVPI